MLPLPDEADHSPQEHDDGERDQQRSDSFGQPVMSPSATREHQRHRRRRRSVSVQRHMQRALGDDLTLPRDASRSSRAETRSARSVPEARAEDFKLDHYPRQRRSGIPFRSSGKTGHFRREVSTDSSAASSASTGMVSTVIQHVMIGVPRAPTHSSSRGSACPQDRAARTQPSESGLLRLPTNRPRPIGRAHVSDQMKNLRFSAPAGVPPSHPRSAGGSPAKSPLQEGQPRLRPGHPNASSTVLRSRSRLPGQRSIASWTQAPDSTYHPGVQRGTTWDSGAQGIIACSVRITESRGRSRSASLSRVVPLGIVGEQVPAVCEGLRLPLAGSRWCRDSEQWN